MADTESIMRLGIEAARAGDKDEARNLFRLLTREQPDNMQAWLWLAGVAEDREEKRVALERVLALDPTNDLARKGLQALGVAPQPAQEEQFSTRQLSQQELEQPEEWEPVQAEEPPPVVDDPASRPPDEEFAAALDSLDSYESYNRGETSAVDNYTVPDFSEDEGDLEGYENRPRVRPEDIELEPEPEAELAPQRRSNLLPILLIVGAAVIASVVLLMLLNGGDDGGQRAADGGQQQAGQTPAAGTEGVAGILTPDASGGPTDQIADTTAVTGTVAGGETAAPTDPAAAGSPTTAPAPQPDASPTAAPAPQPTVPGELASANPQPVGPNTILEVPGWTYNFPAPSFSTVIGGALGTMQPQGRWVVVLMWVYNGSGQPQQMPADMFVLKDAQGRVYTANPDASELYVNTFGRGVAADFSMKDQLPAGVTVSIPLLFDVATGATDLTVFASQNPGQGYVVQSNIQ